jgi:hypothetical protein
MAAHHDDFQHGIVTNHQTQLRIVSSLPEGNQITAAGLIELHSTRVGETKTKVTRSFYSKISRI